MKIRVVKDWVTPDILYQQSPKNDGIWDDFVFTYDEIDSCDYLVVFNRPAKPFKIKCPPGNRWLISGEPPNPAFRWQIKSYKHFDKIFSPYYISISIIFIYGTKC